MHIYTIIHSLVKYMGFPDASAGKKSTCNVGDLGSIPGLGRSLGEGNRYPPQYSWRRKWQPTPVFLPGEFQGRGSLMGCCLWGRTKSDTTEVT